MRGIRAADTKAQMHTLQDADVKIQDKKRELLFFSFTHAITCQVRSMGLNLTLVFQPQNQACPKSSPRASSGCSLWPTI